MNLREKYNIPAQTVITIAGTVGVGKSTMTQALAEALNFRTSYEKVDTNPYLDKFYEDFAAWSFHLQVYFLVWWWLYPRSLDLRRYRYFRKNAL